MAGIKAGETNIADESQPGPSNHGRRRHRPKQIDYHFTDPGNENAESADLIETDILGNNLVDSPACAQYATDREWGLEHFRPLAATMRAIFPGRDRKDWPKVAVLTFYGDASQDKDQRVFALAGYVSTADEWDEFSKEWLSVIHDPSWPSTISEFHAVDCENQREEFAGWEKVQCTALVTKLVDVILSSQYKSLRGAGCAAMVDDLTADPSITGGFEKLEAGYALAGPWIFLAVLGSPLSREHGDAIEFIFDNQPEVKGRILALYELLRNPRDRELIPVLKWRLSDPIFRSSGCTPPLQAADLLAYETQKHAFNRRYDAARDTRISLRRLIEGRRHRGFWLTREFYDEIKRVEKSGEHPSFSPPDIYQA